MVVGPADMGGGYSIYHGICSTPRTSSTTMQGVRTTRGCLGCRKRKKACDFGKPTCERCRRLNISCRYEDRQFIFVSEIERSANRTPPQRSTCTAKPSTALTGLSQDSLLNTDIELQADAAFWNLYLPQANHGS